MSCRSVKCGRVGGEIASRSGSLIDGYTLELMFKFASTHLTEPQNRVYCGMKSMSDSRDLQIITSDSTSVDLESIFLQEGSTTKASLQTTNNARLESLDLPSGLSDDHSNSSSRYVFLVLSSTLPGKLVATSSCAE